MPRYTQTPIHIDCLLRFNRKNEAYLGDKRVALLEGIANTGSISQAAKQIGMSYKAAWDAVDAMNNLAEKPLLVRSIGGKNGGGTVLTEFGKHMIEVYRFMQAEYELLLQKLNIGSDEFAGVNHLLKVLTMKSSARNQFVGKVNQITKGAVIGDVLVHIGEGVKLFANITNDAIDHLQLAPGKDVVAIIKASFVLLSPDENVRVSTRNRLTGVVVKHAAGAVNTEIKIELPGGKILTAIVTNESVEEFGFAIGSKATALIKASHVILAVYD